jgi:hypothetical protein
MNRLIFSVCILLGRSQAIRAVPPSLRRGSPSLAYLASTRAIIQGSLAIPSACPIHLDKASTLSVNLCEFSSKESWQCPWFIHVTGQVEGVVIGRLHFSSQYTGV